MGKKYMFDTCAFNHLLEKNFDPNIILQKGLIYVTHIQRDEINNWRPITKDKQDKKELLCELFNLLQEDLLPTESFVLGFSRLGQAKLSKSSVPTSTAIWGVSRWGEAIWTDPNTSFYEEIKTELDKLKKKPNNIQDALIGETALKNNFVLVTDDGNFKKVMEKFGCDVVTLEEFLL